MMLDRPRTDRLFVFVFAALVMFLASVMPIAAAQGLTTAPIIDPAYGIKAFTITIPAGWKFQGSVLPAPDCTAAPSPLFRAYSSDGLTEIRLLPAFNWTFHPNLKMNTPTGCMDFGQAMKAADFLRHFEDMMASTGMHVISTMPIAPSYQRRVDGVAQNMGRISPMIHASADAAAVRVATHNGSFVIEQRFRVYVECRVSNQTSGPYAGGGCSAHVDVLRAPQGKLDALAQLVDANDLVRTPNEAQWAQRVQQTNAQRNAQRFRELTRQEQASAAMLKQQHDQFMASMQRNHDAFMAQQESSFRSSMNSANIAMNARTTAASDWVDYALDQQTVTGSGGTTKVSSAYSNTWSNGQGQWYQTNDPNANPNGALSGNWTPQTRVHGNGQP